MAKFIGIANPNPENFSPPTIKVLIPINSPFRFIKGPPEFPGLIEASVCKKSRYSVGPRSLCFALIIPVVTVKSKPKGLPIAITLSPTSTASESPNSIAVRYSALIFSKATSVCGSEPISLALNILLSLSLTVMFEESLTT